MQPWWPLLVSGCTAVIALLALLRTVSQGWQAQAEKMQAAHQALQDRVIVMETRMEPLIDLIRQHLSTLLVRPTHLELDALLARHQQGTLTLADARLLRRYLDEIYLAQETIREEQRVVAVLVAWAVDALIVRLEQEEAARPSEA